MGDQGSSRRGPTSGRSGSRLCGVVAPELGGGFPGAEPAFNRATMGDRGGQGDRRVPARRDGLGDVVN